MKVLLQVLYLERRLRTEELGHALEVEIGSPDLDPESVPGLNTLSPSHLSLVTVASSPSTVQLGRFTLQEHLLCGSTRFRNPHSTIAEGCLRYFNFGYFRLFLILCPTPLTMSPLESTSFYPGEYIRGMTEIFIRLLLELLDRFAEHISTPILLQYYNQDRLPDIVYYSKGGARIFIGLYGFAYLGMMARAAALSDMMERDVMRSISGC